MITAGPPEVQTTRQDQAHKIDYMDEVDNRTEEMDDELEQEIVEEGESSGKYDRLLNDSSRKYRLSGMFKEWFLD